MKVTKAYIGLDVHKETIAVAIAEEGPTREVVFHFNFLYVLTIIKLAL